MLDSIAQIRRTRIMALISLVSSVVSLLLPIALVPIILGDIALKRARNENGGNVDIWLANIGIAIGFVALFYHFFFIGLIGHSRDKVKQSCCASSLKQLAFAVDMYSTDYDNKLPEKSNWSSILYPYNKNIRMYKCPMDKSSSKCSYSYNNKLDANSLLNIKKPDTIPVLFDSKGGWNSIAPVTAAVPWHGDFANFAYLDCHVKTIKVRKRGPFTFLHEFPFYY